MIKKTKILLILVHSTQNSGDLALLEISIQFFKKYFPDAEFVISANFPDEKWYQDNGFFAVPSPLVLVGNTRSVSPYLQVIRFILGCLYAVLYKYGLKKIVPKDWRLLFHEYETSTFVAAVPGNQFFHTGSFVWPFPVKIFLVALTHFFEKPFYVLPQSIGPFRRWWEKKLLQWAYSKAKYVFLRDQISLEVAQEIGLPENKVLFSPDPAFALVPAARAEAQALLKKYRWNPAKPSIGVTIIAPMGKSLDLKLVNRYYEILSKELVQFSKAYNMQIVLFTQVAGPTAGEDDRIPTQKIFEILKAETEVFFVDQLVSPALLKACYGEMSLFLASRLHSGIFAMGMGIPVLFIGYLTKTKGVLKSFDLDEYGIELRELEKCELYSRLERLWLSRESIASDFNVRIRNLTQQIDMPYRLIWEQSHD